MPINTAKLLRSLLGLVLFAAGAYVLVRWLLPFPLAWGAAALMEPAVSRLCRHGFRRGAAAGVCLIAALLALGGLLWLPLHRLVRELSELSEGLPELLSALSGTLGRWDALLSAWLEKAPESLRGVLEQTIRGAEASLTALPGKLSAKLLGLLPSAAAAAPSLLLSAITAVLGAYFISASYPELLHGAARLLPERALCRARLLRRDLRRTIGRWFRAQLIMLAITFAVLSAAFLLLRVRYALLLALGTAVVDALPVLGTGTVLLPWAAYEVLTGGVPLGLGLAITYAAVTLLHQSIQAKLLGDSLGLHPLAALLSVYAGFRVWGVWGMVSFPILAVSLRQIADSGVLSGLRGGEH